MFYIKIKKFVSCYFRFHAAARALPFQYRVAYRKYFASLASNVLVLMLHFACLEFIENKKN